MHFEITSSFALGVFCIFQFCFFLWRKIKKNAKHTKTKNRPRAKWMFQCCFLLFFVLCNIYLLYDWRLWSNTLHGSTHWRHRGARSNFKGDPIEFFRVAQKFEVIGFRFPTSFLWELAVIKKHYVWAGHPATSNTLWQISFNLLIIRSETIQCKKCYNVN